MRKCGVLSVTLIATVLLLASSNSSEAAEESPFFLQDQGKVRVLRGIDPGKNFDTAKVPEEEAPAAEPEPQAEAASNEAEEEPKFTRRMALERARARGITVHRAGVRQVRGPESGRTRQEALKRSRARGIPVNRAGG